MIAVVLVIAVVFAALWSPPAVEEADLKAVNRKAHQQEVKDEKRYHELIRTK